MEFSSTKAVVAIILEHPGCENADTEMHNADTFYNDILSTLGIPRVQSSASATRIRMKIEKYRGQCCVTLMGPCITGLATNPHLGQQIINTWLYIVSTGGADEVRGPSRKVRPTGGP